MKILLKRSGELGKVPTLDDLDLGELAINFADGKLYFKQIKDEQERIVEFYSNIELKNVIFVQKNGSDSNDGKSWDSAFLTIERAVQKAAELEATVLIEVAPGIYNTKGHIDFPDNTIIKATHRTVVISPETGYEERNVFRLGSGCFVEGFVFEGWRLDSLDDPNEGFAVCFRPGAVIRRAPYVHKVVVRTTPFWDTVAPPLDRQNANPLVGRGAGVILADGAVCSPYSIYPNIMAWGATPVSHNGIGYCSKNGALINAVNAISMWAHKHFYAIGGGQILLSACSTQFGDYTMVSRGVRSLVYPYELDRIIPKYQSEAQILELNKELIISSMWQHLVDTGYTTGWDTLDEEYTKRDAATLIQCIVWVLISGNEKPMLDFARGLFDVFGNPVFSSEKFDAFIESFSYVNQRVQSLDGMTEGSIFEIDALISNLIQTIASPSIRSEPSAITAIGHTWSAIMSGVALTKIPPARNFATIKDSIVELDQGVVIASGQDDQGSALFIGGMEINADTGELSGPPFEQAVNRIATRTAIARSF